MPYISRCNKYMGVILIVTLVFLLLEAVFRLAGAVYISVKYPARPAQNISKGLNVLCIGDSFTQGFGAPKGMSYPEQLEKILNEGLDEQINVYKKFYINSSTVLKHFNDDVHKYKPDFVVLMAGCNDTWSLENLSLSAFKETSLFNKMDIWLGSSNVYKFIKILLFNIKSAVIKNVLRMGRGEFFTEGDISFKTQEGRDHFNLGNDYMSEDENEMALKEFKNAITLEPFNPWVHWRMGCIYLYAMHEYAMAKEAAMSALRYGDSSFVERAFLLIRDLSYGMGKGDEEFYAAVDEMKKVIGRKHESDDKKAGERRLGQLLLFHKQNDEITKVVAYNLEEIIKIARKNNVKLILMQYPMRVPCAYDVVRNISSRYGIALVDNYRIFEENLKEFKKEDLFMRDGHCNARGYGIIAQNVYEQVVKEGIMPDVARKM